MAAASTFSYAQAAKGQGAPAAQGSSSNSNSQTEASTQIPAQDKSTESFQNGADVSKETSKVEAAPPTVSEKQEIENGSAADSDARTESVQDRRSNSRRDDDAGRLDRPWRRNDKGTRSSSATTRSVDEHDSRRPRKGKKGKFSDKQANDGASGGQEQKEEPEAPKIELAEAPIPTVNIWQQRREAQQAKKPEPARNGVSAAVHTVQEHARPSGEVDAAPIHVNGGKPAQRANENSKSERNGSRGNRLPAREQRDSKTEIPPPVNDAASWPTPEITIKEDKKKSTDKVDRPEKDAQEEGAQTRPRQKWVTYDYVPSVSFETQIPQMRGSKPRGGAKGASGTRAAAGAQSSEKATTASKSGETRDRPRDTANGTARSTSQLPVNKRASMDVANARGEQRRPTANAGAEKAKDAAQSHQVDQPHAGREGRSERGRGGYRGRGGHALNPHAQHQHSASSMAAPSFPSNVPIPSRAQGPYSPPPRQSGHGQMFMPPPQRGGRGGRNGGANYHRMSLPNGSSRVPPVQTQFSPYEYPMPPMSAMPFQQAPYWDNMVVNMLRNQIEYYFSIENLCKDVYLRAHMDDQGFVPLMFITAFKRMRELSPDVSLIRSVCEESNEIDYILGDDDCERLRRREGWDHFVLPREDRDELARNKGPEKWVWKSHHYVFGQQYGDMGPSQHGMSLPAYPDQTNPAPFQGEHNKSPLVNGVNSHGNDHPMASQLSAEAPDFVSPANSQQSPGAGDNGTAAGVNGLPNGDHSQGADQS